MTSTSTLFLLLAITPLLPLSVWLLTSSLVTPNVPVPSTLRNKRIILLIAHPDDEAMFFAPSLLHLTSPDLGNHLKILCLSTGDADGLGAKRKKELEKSALTLGVRRREDVFVMDDARFADGMQNDWKPDEIAKVLAQAFAPPPSPPPAPTPVATSKHGKKKSMSAAAAVTPPATQPEGPRATIDVLITFDAGGVSGHPNHIALYAGARRFIGNIMKGYAGWRCPVTLYTLPTVNIVRKYSFVVDIVVTLAAGVVENLLGDSKSKDKAGADGERALFLNDLSKYWKARDAMVRGHESQMVWFRWGWISLGRYMVVNDLKRERVAGS